MISGNSSSSVGAGLGTVNANSGAGAGPGSVAVTTSQCLLTPDGKALSRDYGAWVTIEISPNPTVNSVIMSWPQGYALPG